MALSWKENYATLISANTWNESVEGYKVTNVFGLAWNYYVMYTKFITGVDLTLDLGGKFEFFFADTYKIGYANETAFGKAGRTDLQNLRCALKCKKAYRVPIKGFSGNVKWLLEMKTSRSMLKTLFLENRTWMWRAHKLFLPVETSTRKLVVL